MKPNWYLIKTIIFLAVAFVYYLAFLDPTFFSLDWSRGNTGANIIQNARGSPIHINFTIIPINLDERDRQVVIEIDSIILIPWNMGEIGETICIKDIEIKTFGRTSVMSLAETHPFLNQDLCKNPRDYKDIYGMSSITMFDKYEDNFHLSDTLFLENDPFFYPYDNFDIQTAGFITIINLDKTGKVINEIPVIPEMFIENRGNEEWDLSQSFSRSSLFWENWPTTHSTSNIYFTKSTYQTFIDQGLQEPVVIHYKRSLVIRVVFPIICFSLLLLTYFLAMVDSLDLFLSGAIALLIGLFGIREVLIPNNLSSRNLVDIAVLGLYVTFGISTLFQFIKFLSKPPISNKELPNHSRHHLKVTRKQTRRNN